MLAHFGCLLILVMQFMCCRGSDRALGRRGWWLASGGCVGSTMVGGGGRRWQRAWLPDYIGDLTVGGDDLDIYGPRRRVEEPREEPRRGHNDALRKFKGCTLMPSI